MTVINIVTSLSGIIQTLRQLICHPRGGQKEQGPHGEGSGSLIAAKRFLQL